MPFSTKIKEEALAKSHRYCCVCHEKHGRNLEIHHIIQEADGGSNELSNAIVLCFDCHADAGHYNPKHPRGTKYSIPELKKHRDNWWKYCEGFDPELKPENINETHPLHPSNLPPNEFIEKKIGTLWSNYTNYPVQIKIVKFKGRLIAEYVIYKDPISPHSYQLYQITNEHYIVYHNWINRADYGCAELIGAERDSRLNLEGLQENFPELATKAGLYKVQVLP
jgi:hypothetical protein